MRRLAHEPLGWRPTTLMVTVCRYRCDGCGRVWRQDTSKAAPARAVAPRSALGVEGLVVAHPSMARVADGLGVAWNTGAGDESSKLCTATGAAPGTRCTRPGGPCTPAEETALLPWLLRDVAVDHRLEQVLERDGQQRHDDGPTD